jgi:molybdate transport system regulatory protein
MARLTIRIDLSSHGAIGPGKIRLLELLGESGSISAAGRAMRMSYRRAWTLIDGLNRSFRAPLVTKHPGGARGGGATLTALGHDVIARYRAVERAAAKASAAQLAALDAARAGGPPPRRGERARVDGGRPGSPLMPRRARR